jgi:septal ring factor EnvC (AmiA/AmiB activator)
MNTVRLAVLSLAATALAACGDRNEDQLQDSEINTTANDLDALANEAADVASEAQQLEQQARELEQEAQQTNQATGPQTPADENIAGM